MTPRKTKDKSDTGYPLSLASRVKKPDLGANIKKGIAILGFIFVAHFLIDLGVAVFVIWSLL